MFSFLPPGGDMPSGTNPLTQTTSTQPNNAVQALLAQIKERMNEESDDNYTFDHVPRAGDDVGA